MEIETGEIYTHSTYGKVKVLRINEDIKSIKTTRNGKRVNRKHTVKFSTDPHAEMLVDWKIVKQEFSKFIQRIEE